ncbi:ferredoxin [Brucella endophytica]|uniref:Ferredoxin n=1 Tax=Brucella endophytica TaxID=1963359 RepID=A0A916SJT3_9HYPH|nr:4Fe-4S dicluster domain-containing protein [Brucella endophytica]GGB01158.1 ferredoxin [Brucella endophytica]
MTLPAYATLTTVLAPFGLIPRGGFVFDGDEHAPHGTRQSPAKCVVLVGHAGSSIWPHFMRWRAEEGRGQADPLDTWSKQVLGEAAEKLGARAVFPSDKPWLPFQQWAQRAEGLKPSPLGLLIHPVYGLWHAYRGALLFDEVIDFPDRPEPDHPCEWCMDKPCLSACPVDAFDGAGFAVARCRDYLVTDAGGACRTSGCLARLACPVGRDYAYDTAQQRFHMAAFMGG